MSDQNQIAIRVSNLSKCFHIYEKPKDRLKQAIIPRLRRWLSLFMRPHSKNYYREFWALRDVSFEIKKGETIGVIGRNGSGKSTLLQLICGTLTPTSGEVKVHGRVAALLELGAGFNPEFTGRENVYMNASVLGLTNDEIDARFESIAAFADIGDFIEQPVKIYSSGMYVRLAFAVIAHVDADILVVDEALSVGDAVFTQKCMRFLRNFMKTGTLIFVSHDTSTVLNLCKHALWLNKGIAKQFADSKSVTEAYLRATLQEVYGSEVELNAVSGDKGVTQAIALTEEILKDAETKVQFFNNLENSTGWNTGAAHIESVRILNEQGASFSNFVGGEKICLAIQVRAEKPIASPIIGFLVKDRLGQDLFGEHTYTYIIPPLAMLSGQKCEAKFVFRLPMLPNGDYSITVSLADGTPWEHIQHHWLHDALILRISSEKMRHGLVGIPFESVTMGIVE